MRTISLIRHTALGALVAIGGVGVAGCAGAQQIADGASSSTPAVASSAPASMAPSAPPLSAPVVAAAAAPAIPLPKPLTPDQSAPAAADDTKDTQGTVAELQQRMRGNELAELRTSYNGSYGASLLFYGKELTYYVVLFQQKNFWRVIKTQNEARAEGVYADFVHKSAQLADVELHRIKVAAQKDYTERLIALSEVSAERLQADLGVARQQQALVASRQKEVREQTVSLETQKRAAQEQLREVRRQVQALQRETEQGLPARRVH